MEEVYLESVTIRQSWPEGFWVRGPGFWYLLDSPPLQAVTGTV